ncbi:MAG TPA: UPF0182 family protein [Gemmatimonadales bacterium]
MTPGRRRLFVALGVAAAVLLLGRLAATVHADRAWYVALGAADLWRAKAANTVILKGGAWLLGTLFLLANLLVVRRSVLKLVVPRRVANIEIDAEVSGRSLLTAAALTAAGVGALLTLAIGDWTTLALARAARPFGEQEFFLEHDLATWTTWLPLERSWYGWSQATLFACTCLVVALYALTPGLRWERGALRTATYVRRHLAVLGALLLLLLAWGYGIERQLALIGGSAADMEVVTGTLSALLVLSILTGAIAVLVLWAGYVGQTRLAFAGVTLVLVAAIGLQHILPAALRWVRRAGTAEGDAWSPGSTRAQFTRRAYAVGDLVHARQVDSTSGFARPAQLAGHVALWSEAAVRAAVELGGWRREVVGGIGWQRSRADGDALIAIAAAREPVTDSLLDAPGGWVVAEIDASRPALDAAAAVPQVRTRPIPPVLVHPAAVGYQLVSVQAGEVAAPALRTGWRRLAASLAVQNPRLFLDGPETAGSRIVRWRDVAERVDRLAPVFQQGGPAVPIVAGDSLFWAVHLYSSSSTYPLSVPLRAGSASTTYFRHAAVALVNAHTGRVAIVPVERPDPLAAAWMARFPSLQATAPGVPRELLALLPPPLGAVRAQVLALVVSGGVVREEGEAPVPVRLPPPWGADSAGGAGGWNIPYLPPADSAPPTYAIPLVGAEDDRPRAVVIASGGLSPRTIVVPLDTLGPGWSRVLERLRAGTSATAGEATMRSGRSGAAVVAGPMQVLPTTDGALLFQPQYVWHPDGPPELALVALAAGDSIRRAPTLEALLASGDVGAGEAGEGDTGDVASRAARLYDAMRDALRRGDWRAFGEAFDALGRALGAPAPRP